MLIYLAFATARTFCVPPPLRPPPTPTPQKRPVILGTMWVPNLEGEVPVGPLVLALAEEPPDVLADHLAVEAAAVDDGRVPPGVLTELLRPHVPGLIPAPQWTTVKNMHADIHTTRSKVAVLPEYGRSESARDFFLCVWQIFIAHKKNGQKNMSNNWPELPKCSPRWECLGVRIWWHVYSGTRINGLDFPSLWDAFYIMHSTYGVWCLYPSRRIFLFILNFSLPVSIRSWNAISDFFLSMVLWHKNSTWTALLSTLVELGTRRRAQWSGLGKVQAALPTLTRSLAHLARSWKKKWHSICLSFCHAYEASITCICTIAVYAELVHLHKLRF